MNQMRGSRDSATGMNQYRARRRSLQMDPACRAASCLLLIQILFTAPYFQELLELLLFPFFSLLVMILLLKDFLVARK